MTKRRRAKSGDSQKKRAPRGPEPRAARPEPPARKRRLGVGAALCVVFLAVGAGAAWFLLSDRSTPVELVTTGSVEGLDPDLYEYVLPFEARVRQAPRDASRHVELGLVYAANLLWPEAQQCFANATRLGASGPLPLYYTAISSLKVGDTERALAEFRETTSEYRNFAPAFDRLGAMLVKRGDLDGAEAAFRTVLKLDGKAPQGYVGLGDVLGRRGRYEEAADLLEQAVRIRPQDRTAHYLLGNAYRKLGRDADAKRELTLGRDAQRSHMFDEYSIRMSAHRRLVADRLRAAFSLIQQRKLDEAVAILEDVLQAHPEDVFVMNNLAMVYMEQNEVQKARTLLEKTFEISENPFLSHINLAALDMQVGRMREALEHADEAIRLSPTTPEAHLARSMCLLRLKPPRVAEARAAMQTAVRLNPWNAEAFIRLAHASAALKDYDVAVDYYRQTLELSPDFLVAHLGLGDVLLILGRRDEAQKSLNEAKRIAPNDPRVAALENKLRRRSP